MFNQTHFLGKFAIITITALLTLTLFDSNPWWKVLFYSIPTTLLNTYLTGLAVQQAWRRAIIAPVQGIAAAFLAYLASLTTIFRVTLGTLVGFALLLGVAELLFNKVLMPKNHGE
jgi:hypothetical protein